MSYLFNPLNSSHAWFPHHSVEWLKRCNFSISYCITWLIDFSWQLMNQKASQSENNCSPEQDRTPHLQLQPAGTESWKQEKLRADSVASGDVIRWLHSFHGRGFLTTNLIGDLAITISQKVRSAVWCGVLWRVNDVECWTGCGACAGAQWTPKAFPVL